MTTPLQIVSGFLGAGKTSAIRAQLESRRGERVAVIVNDFGEASLDESALAESEPFRITNIPGGCVCCTAPEGFVDALGAVLDGEPDRILIEPTGLARPQDLIDTIRRCAHRNRVALGPVVVLVDPARVGRFAAEERDVADQQIGAADVLVANRTDLCSEDDLRRFDAWARELWPPPLAVHRTTQGRVPPALLEWPEGEGGQRPRAVGAAPAHQHSAEGFRARTLHWPADVVFSRDRLWTLLQRLARGETEVPLARFKGVFRTSEGVIRFELAGDTVHEAPSPHRRDSRADAIGRGDAAEPLERLAQWLAAAVLSAQELAARAHQIEIALPDGRSHVVDRPLLASLPDPIPDVSTLFPKRSGSAARLQSLWQRLDLPTAGRAVVCAADGFASEPVDQAALCQGVLLHSVAGEPLPASQGGPFRLLIPADVEGAPSSCANVKGVVRIVMRPPA